MHLLPVRDVTLRLHQFLGPPLSSVEIIFIYLVHPSGHCSLNEYNAYRDTEHVIKFFVYFYINNTCFDI